MPNNFSANTIVITNYFQNHQFIKTKDYKELILEKKYSSNYQNIIYIRIFNNKFDINIFKKDKNKFDN